MEKKYDVIALGELLIDFPMNGKSGQGNNLFEACPGGAPCNVLALLNKMGKKTAFLGKVGEDQFGTLLRDTITEAGIDASHLMMDKDVNTPRLPSYKREKELREGYLREFSLTDLEDQDESHYGLSGSPTQVERIFPPEKSECREMFDGSPDVLADKMYHVLRETKFI